MRPAAFRRGATAKPRSDATRCRLAQGATVFAVALLLRAVYMGEIADAPLADLTMGDARAYDVWAREIAAGNLGALVRFE